MCVLRSAGATLRRYCEAALEQEVRGLLTCWTPHLRGATAIFIRTPKTHQSMFTGGRDPPLSRDDPRVRGIPFPTRRPTLKEVKRVHSCLASIYIENTPTRPVVTETVPVATVAEVTEVESTVPSVNEVGSEENGGSGDGGGGSGDDGGGSGVSDDGDVGDDGDIGEGGDNGDDGGRSGTRKKKKKKKKRVERPWTECGSISPSLILW